MRYDSLDDVFLGDGRTARGIYPWRHLFKAGDSFHVPDITKRKSLYSCAKRQGIKVSIRQNDAGLQVIRIN